MNLDQLRTSIAEAAPTKGKVVTGPGKLAADFALLSSNQFGSGEVLAFDQSLTNTGFVRLQAGPDLVQYPGQPLRLRNRDHYKYKATPGEPQGSLLTLRKTAALARWMEAVLRAHGDVRTVIYEMPVVAGHRPESILMGAYALFEACRNTNRPEPISVNNQHAKKVIVGRSRDVSKAQVKIAVQGFCPDWMHQGIGPWNEHVVDATMLGMTWLHDNKEIA